MEMKGGSRVDNAVVVAPQKYR